MKKIRFIWTVAAAFGWLVFLVAPATAQTHVMSTAAEAKWGPAPPALPPGAQAAVLAGDPGKPGPFTVRVKLPANYSVPAHSHTSDENIVMLSGELFMGMGSKLSTATAKGMGAGSYMMVPANMNHFVFTKAETTFIVYGNGPLEFKYVNAADDPRNKK